jgi:hypothetical protein
LIVPWNQRQTTTEILAVTASASFKITRIEEEPLSTFDYGITWLFENWNLCRFADIKEIQNF